MPAAQRPFFLAGLLLLAISISFENNRIFSALNLMDTIKQERPVLTGGDSCLRESLSDGHCSGLQGPTSIFPVAPNRRTRFRRSAGASPLHNRPVARGGIADKGPCSSTTHLLL